MSTLNELMQEYWRITHEIDKQGVDLKLNTYAAPHVWNLVAKTLRERYATHTATRRKNTAEVLHARREIEAIALDFAQRFTQDNGFDPIAWLDQCSPDPEAYPFSELWKTT